MDTLQEYFGIESFDFEGNKRKLVDNLNLLKSMSVEEQTFYKKWMEIQTCESFSNKANMIKAKIWTPTDINDESLTIKEIESINPKLVYVESKQQNEELYKEISDLLGLYAYTKDKINIKPYVIIRE